MKSLWVLSRLSKKTAIPIANAAIATLNSRYPVLPKLFSKKLDSASVSLNPRERPIDVVKPSRTERIANALMPNEGR